MIKAIASEFRKTRRRKVWLIVAALLAIQFVWIFWGMSRMDAHDLEQGWETLLFQFPIFNSIIMPVAAAVIASRLCDIEHKGQTLRQLETLMPAGKFFDAKFLFGSIFIAAITLIQILAMILAGTILGFKGNIPVIKFGYYFLFNTSINLTILLLQQVLSLLFPNQMVSLSVGLLGGLVSIFLLYLPQVFSKFVVWGYYGELILVQMDWNPATRIINYSYIPANWPGFTILLIAFCGIYIIGRRLFIKKEA